MNEDLSIVREFLTKALKDGFYSFNVRGEVMLLEEEKDINLIINRMSLKDDETWKYWVSETKGGLEYFKRVAHTS